MRTIDDIVSVSYDRFPSPKGAATHIHAFASALGKRFGRVHLLTVPPLPPELGGPPGPVELPGVEHVPIPAAGEQVIERVLDFRSHLWAWWRHRFGVREERPRIAHVRSIFEGYPIARDKPAFCDQLVYEVNGLPSIEMKYRYPAVAGDRELLGKLERQEQACFQAADLVVTVSEVNARHLTGRGVPEDRIRVIRNGVDFDCFSSAAPRPWGEREVRMLYAGTLSSWQGVEHAIEALALYRRDFPARMTMVGPARSRRLRELRDFAHRLGVFPHLDLVEPVSRPVLARLHHEADVVLAPLTKNDRNCDQGCCPIKVLEAMASGTPLIASDLEVVRELCTDDVEALLVRPGSGKAIKDGMLRLRADPDLGARLSRAARERVERDFAWSRAQAELVAAYEELVSRP